MWIGCSNAVAEVKLFASAHLYSSCVNNCTQCSNSLFDVSSQHEHLSMRALHVCEQLAQGCYLTAQRPGVEHVTSWVASPSTLTTPPLRQTVHHNDGLTCNLDNVHVSTATVPASEVEAVLQSPTNMDAANIAAVDIKNDVTLPADCLRPFLLGKIC